MSLEHHATLHEQLALGNTLPKANVQVPSSHLFVSLSELIAESVFYHPALVSGVENLTALEKSSLGAMLDGKPLAHHFVETLVTQIENNIEAHHDTIRVCLSAADSYAFQALLGGSLEHDEINPVMGVRGVARFASSDYSAAFAMECDVIKQLRKNHHNVEIVVPFVRTLSDAATIIDRLAEQGLPRGLNGLKVLYVCNVPSSVMVADRLLHYFDGVVLDWESLAQFTLGIDKLNESLAYLYNPDSESITQLADIAIKAAHQAKKPVLVVTQSLESYPKLQNYLLENAQAEAIFNF